jgi:hypothetical protein
MAEEYIDFGTPVNLDQSDGTPATVYCLGCEERLTVAGTAVACTWFAPTTAPTVSCNLLVYRKSDQALLASTGAFTPTLGVNNVVDLITPVALDAYTGDNSTVYVATVLTNRYTFTLGGFPFAQGNLTAPATGGPGGAGNGRYREVTAGNPAFPNNIHPSAANYFVGLVIDVAAPIVSATIGLVTETGTAFPITRRKIFSIGSISESGLVLPPSYVKSKSIGHVTETGEVKFVSANELISREIGCVYEFSGVGPVGEPTVPDTEVGSDIALTEVYYTSGLTEVQF